MITFEKDKKYINEGKLFSSAMLLLSPIACYFYIGNNITSLVSSIITFLLMIPLFLYFKRMKPENKILVASSGFTIEDICSEPIPWENIANISLVSHANIGPSVYFIALKFADGAIPNSQFMEKTKLDWYSKLICKKADSLINVSIYADKPNHIFKAFENAFSSSKSQQFIREGPGVRLRLPSGPSTQTSGIRDKLERGVR